MTIDPTMEIVDGEQRWYRIGVGRRVLHAGQELTKATHPRQGGRARLTRLRFLHAIGLDRRLPVLVCADADGDEHLVTPSSVRTIHRTRKLPETDR